VLINADARHIPLKNEIVQCIVTSPPYWGLRDYGVEGQIGLEPTPELYVQQLTEIFREVRRVLRKDGTLWLNLGDSYAGSAQGWGKKGQCAGQKQKTNAGSSLERYLLDRPPNYISSRQPNGLKPKDLVGIPWRVAFALHADGWWLRSDIIWYKPNPMPESVRDRPTKAHEYVFLFAKSRKYYYDADAVKEECASGPSDIKKMIEGKDRIGGKHKGLSDNLNKASSATRIGRKRAVGSPEGRNRRSVWTIATQPYKGAHFATFPEKLVEPCILAGSRPQDLILDPFAGTATVGRVCLKYQRRFVGLELKLDYIKLAQKRLTA